MSSTDPAGDLVERWRAGDQDAARLLFDRYAQRLTALAEDHLSRKLAGRLDGEDVVQSVFRTFFRRSAEGEFRIDQSTALWQLLVKITLCKVRSKARFHTAARRNVDAESRREIEYGLPDMLGAEPGPTEAAELVDEIETLLDGLPDVHGEILALRLAGHTVTDIAKQVGLSRQGVYRVLDLMQDRMMKQTPV